MITIALIYDLERNTDVGEDVSAEFQGAAKAQPLSAIVVGPCSTTWCYPNSKTVHFSFSDEMAAIDWMKTSQDMSNDEISFHLTQKV